MGWVIVLLYLLVAFTCSNAAYWVTPAIEQTRREQIFWSLCVGILGFLAINKQLDLQTLLTSVARCMAVDEGWYDDRRIVQSLFITGILVAGIVLVGACGLLLRGTFARTGLAILGLGFVSMFVVIRAASFHHVDSLINSVVLGLRLTWALEMLGPVLILIAAIRAGKAKKP